MKKVVDEIQEVYLNDDRPLYIGFSGGKDSTVVLDLATKALMLLPEERRTKQVYVLFSDTLLEMPPVIGQIHRGIERFIGYVTENKLPFIFHKVEPEFKNRFFNQVIGKGATLPRTDMRWCTMKMKITPMETAVNAVLAKHNGYIALTGARSDESLDRAARLKRNAVSVGSKMKIHSDSRCNLFCPIEDWSSEDVWNYIYSESESWVDANALGIVYSEAAGDGDECTTVLEGGDTGQKPGCSKSARYGCWVCPLFDRDKTLGNLAKGHEYLTHMEEFRNWLVQYRDGRWDECRDVYNHVEGFPRLQYSYDNPRFGMTCPGGYSLDFRKEILRRLLDTEARVRVTNDIRLIEDEDLEYIQHLWLKEGDLSLSCLLIAKEFGRKICVSDDDLVLARYAEVLFSTNMNWRGRMMFWFGIYPDKRFCTQFIIERFRMFIPKEITLFSNGDIRDEIRDFFLEFTLNDDVSLFMAQEVSKLKMKTQFYPTPELMDLIYREWREDKISFVTSSLINDFEDTVDEEKEDGYDFLEDENISLADKMATLDNWNYYTQDDRKEKYHHDEYNSLGGNFNSIKFRKRVDGLKKSPSEYQVKTQEILQGQGVFQFVA